MLNAAQRAVITWLRSRQSAESYLSGGALLNAHMPRLSYDIDIFSSEPLGLNARAKRDIESLREAGLQVRIEADQPHYVEATVRSGEESTLVEWSFESMLRFFPLVEDPEYGWRLSTFDMAVNKVCAAATRQEARDVIDLIMLDQHYLPAGQLIWAAAGKLTGETPVRLVEEIARRASGHTAEDFELLAFDEREDELLEAPVSALMVVLQEARTWIEEIADLADPELYGKAFVDAVNGLPRACGAPDILDGTVQPHAVTKDGVFPVFAGQSLEPLIGADSDVARERRRRRLVTTISALEAVQERVKAARSGLTAYFALEDDAVAYELLRAERQAFRERLETDPQADIKHEILTLIEEGIARYRAELDGPGGLGDGPP